METSTIRETQHANLPFLQRFWPVFVLFPVLYGVFNLMALIVLTRTGDDEAFRSYERVGFATKFTIVPCFPVLFALLAERVAAKPSRWKVLAGTWAVVGTLVVLFVARYQSTVAAVGNTASYQRLWPDQPVRESELEIVDGLGSRYTEFAVVTTEILIVFLIAIVSSLILRYAAIRIPWLAAAVVPVTVFGILVLYVALLDYPFIPDFDFFVGDAVLGGTFAELLFAPAPFDMAGGAALGIAAATMGTFLAIWPPPVQLDDDGDIKGVDVENAPDSRDI